MRLAGKGCHIPLIPALRRERPVTLCEFMDRQYGQGYTEKPCRKKNNNIKQQQTSKEQHETKSHKTPLSLFCVVSTAGPGA